MQKLKVLVSCYACSPYHGSEPGMGWNFVYGISRFHEVHVIVEQEKWEEDLKKYVSENSDKCKNLNFYFIRKKRNRKLRKIWPPSYYYFYRQWQKKAFNLAVELHKKENFDIVHQLNMVGFREPGYLWKMDIPFVWGPIGGMDNSPWSFLPSLGLKGLLYVTGRNLINAWQRRFLTRPKKAAQKNNSKLIAATPGNAAYIKKMWGRGSTIIAEIGQEVQHNVNPARRKGNEAFKIIWSGRHTSRKNLVLLLNALRNVRFPFELHILGAGEMTEKWKKTARENKIADSCIWYGWVDRNKAIETMSKGHILCITSISDLTSTVTLEALSYGLPIIALDHLGFAHVINDNCGIKVPVISPKEAQYGFAKAIEKLYANENLRLKLAYGAIERAKDFSWEKKIEKLNSIYLKLVNEDTPYT